MEQAKQNLHHDYKNYRMQVLSVVSKQQLLKWMLYTIINSSIDWFLWAWDSDFPPELKLSSTFFFLPAEL